MFKADHSILRFGLLLLCGTKPRCSGRGPKEPGFICLAVSPTRPSSNTQKPVFIVACKPLQQKRTRSPQRASAIRIKQWGVNPVVNLQNEEMGELKRSGFLFLFLFIFARKNERRRALFCKSPPVCSNILLGFYATAKKKKSLSVSPPPSSLFCNSGITQKGDSWRETNLSYEQPAWQSVQGFAFPALNGMWFAFRLSKGPGKRFRLGWGRRNILSVFPSRHPNMQDSQQKK